ncbi:hypothetical protein LUZ62_044075 [Rhynchospora pubera]|uniref:PGG domain-containing protein n=1 Tax=Rhynchospora pubera TaxID=906938 RepID=A0AAV8FHA3_9POAL|nr:hypothetical protein LUZ62_044075 [Rhynchospora pubera]
MSHTQLQSQIPSSPNHQDLSETSNSPPRNGPNPMLPESLNNAQNGTTREVPTIPQNQIEQQETRQVVAEDDQEFFKEMRGWLMIVAILAAGSTYQAGLNPPGSVWQEDDKDLHHVAGNPILHDKFFKRYQAFFYCNAISFLSSLVIIIFLMNKTFYRERTRIKVLEITMVLDLFSFMAAYAVGSCRRVTSSIYVFLLMGGVFVYVISFARHYSLLRGFAHQMPCVRPCIRARENQMQHHVRFRQQAEA